MAGVQKLGKKKSDIKPICKYGRKCYRKNQEHLQNYRHSDDGDSADDEVPKPVGLKKGKNKAEKTIDVYFGKVKQPHNVSDSESDGENVDQPPKKKTRNSDSTEEKKTSPEGGDKEEKPLDKLEENVEDIEDFDDSIPDSPEDVKENIKNKFLVDMPDDFYKFWKFCQSLNPEDPRCALQQTLNLVLVGPFDILSGRHKEVRKNKHGRRPNFLLHYRYFYDPPEFQTVIASNEKSQFHLGYYRDDPREDPAFVASSTPGESSAEKIYPCGENLFAAVYLYAKKRRSSSGKSAELIERLLKSIEKEAKKHNLSLDEITKNMKARKKKVVNPTFHGAGIVVPVDSNDVGYRPVPETPGNLRAMFKKISEAKTESERDRNFEDLQELITLVQFANDECDYGEGLELGLDLFSFGAKVFHPQIASLLPLAYQLLKRQEFSTIITEHLKKRRGVTECVDELVV